MEATKQLSVKEYQAQVLTPLFTPTNEQEIRELVTLEFLTTIWENGEGAEYEDWEGLQSWLEENAPALAAKYIVDREGQVEQRQEGDNLPQPSPVQEYQAQVLTPLFTPTNEQEIRELVTLEFLATIWDQDEAEDDWEGLQSWLEENAPALATKYTVDLGGRVERKEV